MQRFFIVIFVIFLITGCSKTESFRDKAIKSDIENTSKSNKTLVFSGESLHWKSEFVQKSEEFKINGVQKNRASRELTLLYKGDFKPVNLVNYQYEASIGRGYGESSLNKKGYVVTGYTGGQNISVLNPTEIIKVTVEWDGKKEILELKIRK